MPASSSWIASPLTPAITSACAMAELAPPAPPAKRPFAQWLAAVVTHGGHKAEAIEHVAMPAAVGIAGAWC